MTHRESVTFRYDPAPDRRTVAVNGAYAVVSPSGGEVVVHLYIEHASVPLVATQQLDAEGHLVPGTEEAAEKAAITREIQTSLVLSPEVAIGLGEFLQREGNRALSQCGERAKPRSA